MYLLIGHPADRCCSHVERLLRAAGHATMTSMNPLARDGTISWHLTTEHSHSSVRWNDRADLSDEPLNGVFVRVHGVETAVQGWSQRDLAYVQAEANAALVAWLHALECRVVNRPTADEWFRPQRPFGEQRVWFDRCGLPSVDSMITNDLAEGRRFADRWNGGALYAPLTSSTYYRITDESQWNELASVMKRVPVCLIEPTEGSQMRATVVGADVVWSVDPDLSPSSRHRFDVGLRELATLAGVDVLQVEFRQGQDGPRCVTRVPYPEFETYSADAQDRMASGIAQLLMD